MLTATGRAANASPCSSMTGVAVAASSAHAPPGGCRQLSSIITPIAAPTPTAPASSTSSISQCAVSPTIVEMTLPPTTGHGWASGLAGTANSSTAAAPIGATMKGRVSGPPGTTLAVAAATAMPIRAPTEPRASSAGE